MQLLNCTKTVSTEFFDKNAAINTDLNLFLEYGIRMQLERKRHGVASRQLYEQCSIYMLGDQSTSNFLVACCQVASKSLSAFRV